MPTLAKHLLVTLACAAFCGVVLFALACASFGTLPSEDWEAGLPQLPLPVGAAVSSSAPPAVACGEVPR
jgi:hypothetical protein